MRIFLSGTDDVFDVLTYLCDQLEDQGHTPLWFHRPDFPHLSANAMDNCLEVVKTADRFALVLHRRYGLPHVSGVSITEAEYNVAFDLGLPCLVFVRSSTWYESDTYHRAKKPGINLADEVLAQILHADVALLQFIDRLQHQRRSGRPEVPWITAFDHAKAVGECLQKKWAT